MDLLSVNDISTISTEDRGEHARIHRINNETTRIILSPSMVHSCKQISPSPICRLPPELLSSIFLQYTWQWHREYRSTSTAEIPHWVDVSYVCQYWRNVALNCTELWTHLFFVSSRWMDELLRRSKTAPLIIHANVFCLCPDRAMRPLIKALGHMDRVQNLWICFPINVATEVFAGLTAVPAPLLQSFHISSQYRFEVREDIFAGVMPALRKVHLEFCQVHWLSPIFNSALMELRLCCLANHSEMDFHGLLLALRRLSSLRQLYLDRVLSDRTMDNTRNTPVKAILPRLERFTLIGSVSSVTSLLDHFEYPRSTIVRLELECTYLDTQDLTAFRPFINDRFGDHPSLPLSPVLRQPRSLDIRRSGQWGDGWKVACGTSNPADTYGANVHLLERDQDFPFPLQIEFTPMYGGKMALQEIVPFLHTLPVAHLNMITLQGDHSLFYNQCLWTEIFKDAQELCVIRLEYSEANPLIRALQPHNMAPFAYALTDIEFKGVNFKRAVRKKHWSKWSHDHGRSGCFHCLHDALVSRAAAGNVIQRLCFDNCAGITKDCVMKLSELVGKVEWST